MKKKFLSLLLTLAICLSLAPLAYAAQSDIQASGDMTFATTVAVKANGDLVRWYAEEFSQEGDAVYSTPDFSLTTIGKGYKAVTDDYLLKENGNLEYYTVEEKGSGTENFGTVLTNVEQISGRTALKKDGTVWIAGNPLKFSYLTDNAVQVRGNYVLKKDGTLWTWDESNRLSKVMDSVAYAADSMAIKTDGTLWAWGSNNRGQLGIGSVSDTVTSTPVKVMDNVVGAWSSEKDYNDATSCFALTADGSLYSWGNNTSGQLGYPDGNETIVTPPVFGFSEIRYNCQTTPRRVEIDNAVAVHCGHIQSAHSTTIVEKKDGSLWAVGSMKYVFVSGTEHEISNTFRKVPVDGVKVPEPLRFGTSAAPDTQTPAVPDTPSKSKHVTGSLDMPQLSKQEVIDLLKENPMTFSGQVFDSQPNCTAPYASGKLSDAYLQAALDRLNALRRLAGMPATQLDKSWCEYAQHGAVVMGAIGEMTHAPSQPAGMDREFYNKGYAATQSGSINYWQDLITAVDRWMADSSTHNIDRVGHRRWQLSPALDKVGFGYVENGNGSTGKYTVEKNFDQADTSIEHSVNYDSFGWPSAGYFPNDIIGFQADTPWSVSLNPDIYAAPNGITVRLSGGGRSWTFSGRYTPSDEDAYFTAIPANGWDYGSNHCIIFRPDGVDKYEGVYTVTINGLRDKKGNAVDFSYQVEFFSATPADPTGSTETSSGSGNSGAGASTTAPSGTGASTTPSGSNPFTDVPSGAYYTDAVLWAYQNNITSGTTATTFAPHSTCTRGQVVTFLWRAQGEPEPKTAVNPFQDIKASDYYYKAVLWAYENRITSGTTATAFSPKDTCTNGHVVTFLWRANDEPSPTGTSILAGQFKNSYYTSALAWADTTGLLKDTGTAFDPNDMSPRANIVTYLYRNQMK